MQFPLLQLPKLQALLQQFGEIYKKHCSFKAQGNTFNKGNKPAFCVYHVDTAYTSISFNSLSSQSKIIILKIWL